MRQDLFNKLMQHRVGYELLKELGADDSQFTKEQIEAAKVDSWFDN